jgi:hypothetical protein
MLKKKTIKCRQALANDQTDSADNSKKCVTNIFTQTAFPGLLWLKICDNNNKIMLKEVSQQ